MNDLILVTAYCASKEQERALEKCLDSVKDLGCHIALISHTHIPIHLQKKCQYYVYDYNNEISDDHDLIGELNFMFNGGVIHSSFFNKTFYGFAIYRMFAMASQIAINFGYENLHHIEYDCELLDRSLIAEHNKILQQYDSVIYTDNGKEDGFLFGSFKSFKVSSLPNQFKNYNKQFIEDTIKGLELKQLETFTKRLFMKSGKVFFSNELTNERFRRGEKFYSKNVHHTLFYNPEDKTLNLYYKSLKEKREFITLIINKERVINLTIEPNHWNIQPLGLFDEINHVRLDNSDKVIYQKYFDLEFKEIFKTKSYIINEKNN